MSRNSMIKTLVACILLLGVTAIASADNKNTLTGLWERVDSDGELSLITFSRDGTLSVTDGSRGSVGIWEKVGPKTFVVKGPGFLADDDGVITVKYEANGIVELAADGQSYVGEFLIDLKLLDGTTIDVVEYTTSATRVTFD